MLKQLSKTKKLYKLTLKIYSRLLDLLHSNLPRILYNFASICKYQYCSYKVEQLYQRVFQDKHRVLDKKKSRNINNNT